MANVGRLLSRCGTGISPVQMLIYLAEYWPEPQLAIMEDFLSYVDGC